MKKNRFSLYILAVILLFPVNLFSGTIKSRIDIVDPAGEFRSYHGDISRCIDAAVKIVADELLIQGDIEIKIKVYFTDTGSTRAASSSSSLLMRENGIRIYEQGAAALIKGTLKKNKMDHHIRINISKKSMKRYWFDPEPDKRNSAMPKKNVTDIVSTFLHELCHALVFNGWLDKKTGKSRLATGDMSIYDKWVWEKDGVLYFTGTEARKVYGGDVPLTTTNYTHYGNKKPLPGSDLEDYIMFGPFSKYNFRKKLSKLDLAIMKDCGLPVKN